jgi:hypothetical protein
VVQGRRQEAVRWWVTPIVKSSILGKGLTPGPNSKASSKGSLPLVASVPSLLLTTLLSGINFI